MITDSEIRGWIVKRLVAQTPDDDIIYALAHEYGMNWKDAQQLLLRVKAESRQTVARQLAPLYAFIAIATLLVGMVLMFYSLGSAYSWFAGQKFRLTSAFFYFVFRVAPWIWQFFVLGIGMASGGMIGLSRVWGTVLDMFDDKEM